MLLLLKVPVQAQLRSAKTKRRCKRHHFKRIPRVLHDCRWCTSTTGTPISRKSLRHSSLCCGVTLTVLLLYFSMSASPPVCTDKADSRSHNLSAWDGQMQDHTLHAVCSQNVSAQRKACTSLASVSKSVASPLLSTLQNGQASRIMKGEAAAPACNRTSM